MSVESSEALERSVLERKDREELLAIADALGVKPGSRARKADIVDKILQQTGVLPAPDAPEPAKPARGRRAAGNGGRQQTLPDTAAEPAAPADAAAPAEAAAPSPAAAPEPAAPAEAAGPSAEPAAARKDAASTPTPAPAPPARPTAPARPSAPPAAEPAARVDEDVHVDAGPAEPEEADDGGPAPADAARPGAPAPAPAPGEPGEGGSRRRRRRGRDRDRSDRPGGQPFSAAPQGAPVQGGFPQGEPRAEDQQGEPVEVAGYLDLRDEGYGFLRVHGYLPSRDDVYVSVKQTRQYGLRKGDHITGISRPAARNEKNPALLRIDSVNGEDPEQARARPRFEDLTPLFPDQRLRLEDPSNPFDMTARIIDLVAPIGKGQRGMIVSPPKAGKTTVMKTIAKAIERNNPEVKLMVLLIDERPEEVTDMRRSVQGEVIASTFDRPADEHTHVAEMVIERAKRRVEAGDDVVIILDGITRLARAYNLAAPPTGRIMSGGIDTGALYPPKKFFGAARNVEEGGSLTILATALVDTGSRMDEVIFEEFKGTGNMELKLDRRLAERRIFPAIDVDASSTRHEELLFTRQQLQQVWKLRRVLSGLAEGSGAAGLELLIDRLKTFKTNDEFLAEVAKQPTGM